MTFALQNEDDSLPGNAATEAKGLLALLRSGETITSVRKLIGVETEYRKRVRTQFDLLVAHCSKNGYRLRERVNSANVSSELRGKALYLLRQGLSHKAVLQQLPGMGIGIIRELSKTHAIALTSKVGRGRRFTSEKVTEIKRAIAAGGTSRAIERQFTIDPDSVKKFRHELGDASDWRLRTKLSADDLREARAALERGAKWRVVAARFNVSLATLQKSLPYRKNDARHPVEEMVSAFRAGKQIIEVARQFGLDVKTVRGLLRRAGVKAEGTGRRFSPEEKEAILTAIRAGTPNREIAAEFHCHRSRVWQMGAARILRSAND